LLTERVHVNCFESSVETLTHCLVDKFNLSYSELFDMLPGHANAVALIGLPGSGKTTVGRQLARRLFFAFVDSDHEIERSLGCSIRDYFEREGEAAFRGVEQEMLARLLSGDSLSAGAALPGAPTNAPHNLSANPLVNAASAGSSSATSELAAAAPLAAAVGAQEANSLRGTVLSTGGGIVLQPANRELLKSKSHVVYLRATPQELYQRLRHDEQRPLLQVADPLQKLRELFVQRDPLYRETAHFTIDIGRPSVAQLVSMIVMQLELAGVLPAN
jgi:shikimate kinase